MSVNTTPAAEEYSGVGRLLRGGKPLAKVFYYLERRPTPGGFELEGKVTVSQDTPMRPAVLTVLYSAEPLTLVLADSRQLAVNPVRGDRISGSYTITAHDPPGIQDA